MKKSAIALMLSLFVSAGQVSVFAGSSAGKIKSTPSTVKKTAETTVQTTLTTETTTQKPLPNPGRGVRVVTTTAEVTEQTTEQTTEEVTVKEEETETTTKDTETVSASTEKKVEVTTINVEKYGENPTDAEGKPLTGDALNAYNVVRKTNKDKWTAITDVKPVVNVVHNDNVYTANQKVFKFPDNSEFNITRYTFNSSLEERLEQSLFIPGNSIEIRYVDPDTDSWYMSGNYENTSKQTLFIDTDTDHYIVSIPAVYKNNFENNTLEYLPELEEKITIQQSPSGYTLNFSFPVNEGFIGELWYLKAGDTPLVDWNNWNHFAILKQDLAQTRRFSWDGYYFPTPSNYTPYSPTTLYRQPSCYPGASFVQYGSFPATFDLAYVFIYTCMQNQSELGYWPTSPKSGWLATDFNIGAGFYDTRFNTDFAESLLLAYKRYNNDDFLFALSKYCEFFIHHAEDNHYSTNNDGWLVQDYGYPYPHSNTHVSLNHQLSEINLLYKVYKITYEQRYLDLANKMLLAIEDTKGEWVLADNNLNYALYYTANTNIMVDYPYLTYNDLKHTKELYYDIYRKQNETVEYLMKCKLEWMTENGVTGYEK